MNINRSLYFQQYEVIFIGSGSETWHDWTNQDFAFLVIGKAVFEDRDKIIPERLKITIKRGNEGMITQAAFSASGVGEIIRSNKNIYTKSLVWYHYLMAYQPLSVI